MTKLAKLGAPPLIIKLIIPQIVKKEVIGVGAERLRGNLLRNRESWPKRTRFVVNGDRDVDGHGREECYAAKN